MRDSVEISSMQTKQRDHVPCAVFHRGWTSSPSTEPRSTRHQPWTPLPSAGPRLPDAPFPSLT